MAQALGHYLGMDAVAKHERRMSMAQVMQSDAVQARTPDDLDEGVGDAVGQQWSAIKIREHQLVRSQRCTQETGKEHGAGGIRYSSRMTSFRRMKYAANTAAKAPAIPT